MNERDGLALLISYLFCFVLCVCAVLYGFWCVLFWRRNTASRGWGTGSVSVGRVFLRYVRSSARSSITKEKLKCPKK